MFGKLLKNDLKAQWHSMSTIFLCSFIVAIAAELFTIISDNQVIRVLGGVLVILSLGFACIFVLIAVAMMFSKTMFGRAGYLTLTLPVKTGSLIRSKALSGLIWIFSVYALFIGSLLLWIYQVQKELGERVMESVEELLSVFGIPSFMTISITVACTCVSLAVTVLLAVQCLYLGITCSHVSPISKFGNFGAVVVFFVVLFAVQSVTSSVSEAVNIGMVVSTEEIKFTTDVVAAKAQAGSGAVALNFMGTVLRLAAAIGLHYPISYLIKNKVNIK